MTKSILITQCLQRDFVEPIEAAEPLPNKLHVGQDVYLKTELPAPVGPIADLVRIPRLQPVPNSPSFLVDVTFHTPIQRFDDLVDGQKVEPRTRQAG